MKQKLTLLLVLLLGIVLGVAASSWRAFPTEDMIARASCAACHDVHGALEYEDIPFQSQVWILGDVPEASYFRVADLFPQGQETRGTQIGLLELLGQYDVSSFERVAIESLDGGFVVIERQYISDATQFVPYADGMRFKDENQHESTWLKGVRWIIVQGAETPLTIAGQATSMGRLLLGERMTVVAEGGDAMYKSPLDGKIYRGEYAHTHSGASLEKLLATRAYRAVRVTDRVGKQTELSREEIAGSILTDVQGAPTLLLPADNRGAWIRNVTDITPLD